MAREERGRGRGAGATAAGKAAQQQRGREQGRVLRHDTDGWRRVASAEDLRPLPPAPRSTSDGVSANQENEPPTAAIATTASADAAAAPTPMTKPAATVPTATAQPPVGVTGILLQPSTAAATHRRLRVRVASPTSLPPGDASTH